MFKRAASAVLITIALLTAATASATPTDQQCQDPTFVKTNPTLCGQAATPAYGQGGGTPFGIGGGGSGGGGGLGGILHSLTGGLL